MIFFLKNRIARAYYITRDSYYWKLHYLLFGMPFIPYHISYYLVRRFIKPLNGIKVIDFGCGEGALLNQLAIDYSATGIGIDTMNTRLIDASKVASKFSLKVKYINHDVMTYKHSTNYFELGILFDVLEHISDPKKLFKNIATNLKPGGRLIVRVPYGRDEKYLHLNEHFSYGYDTHVKSGYTEKELLQLFNDNGFIVEVVFPHYYKISEFLYELLEIFRRRSKFAHSLIWPILYPFFYLEYLIGYKHDPHGLLVIGKKR